MDCNDVRQLLVVLIDGDLSDEMANNVSEHLQLCRDCAAEFSAVQFVESKLKSQKKLEPPNELPENVLNLIVKQKSNGYIYELKMLAAASILVIVCLSIALSIGTQDIASVFLQAEQIDKMNTFIQVELFAPVTDMVQDVGNGIKTLIENSNL